MAIPRDADHCRPLGLRFGRNTTGWWATYNRRTLTGSTRRGFEHGSFRTLLDFLFVPTRYHVWRYNRRGKR